MTRDFKHALLAIALLAAFGALAMLAPEQLHWLLPLVAIGLGVAGTIPLLRRRALRKWLATRATLTRVDEREQTVIWPPTGKIVYCYPAVEYRYRVGESSYDADVVAPDLRDVRLPTHNGWGDPNDPAERPWHDWQAGGEVTVYYDPRDPRRSVLLREMTKPRRSHFHALIGAGVAVALAWMGVLYIM